MKVALLYNLNRGKHEYEAEFDVPVTIDALIATLQKEHKVVAIEATREFTRWLVQLVLAEPNIVFNVAEGFSGAARESLYPAILEQLALRYSGPGPTELLICHNKSLTKKLLADHDIHMAWSELLRSPDDLESLRNAEVPFPIIVKLNSEGSSLGMDEHCIVHTWDELVRQVKAVWAKFHTNILLEKYIEGTDVSMSYIEGMGEFGPVQYVYPDSTIYDFRLKTKDNHRVDVVPFQDAPNTLRQKLKELTKKIANVLDINGYARADFRITSDGEIYFLEMNAQVNFHPKGAFVLAAEEGGYHFEDVVLHIVRYAISHPRRTSAVGK